MKLKQWAEEEGISLAEAKKLTGLTHWKQKVPDSFIETKSTEASVNFITSEPAVFEAGIVTTTAVETESKEDIDLIRRSINGAGNKSPFWSKRHLIGRT